MILQFEIIRTDLKKSMATDMLAFYFSNFVKIVYGADVDIVNTFAGKF